MDVEDHFSLNTFQIKTMDAVKCVSCLATHPLEYAKTLIQLGYEPLPPKQTTTLFGRPAWVSPSVVQYVGFLHQRDGFFGLYKGVAPKLCECMLSTAIFEQVTIWMNSHAKAPPEKTDGDDDVHTKKASFAHAVFSDLVGRCSAVLVCQPIHVWSVRAMAQFVGQEVQYKLAIGQPPYMPVYTSWVDCWMQLQKSNQLKRGSSLLWRYYQIANNGHDLQLQINAS